ncbi:hypothetical protein BDZ94DRAFT_1224306 [Collybia nuda]|uniref:J domain-containing protein n=1 Tax=Collybia nuda TaxID=64659 RepID=A0A9P6CF14_9AGAR|nr:hypothetical protein BDZ94DRAFT_1224306 [Collybia nuda]
MNPGEAYGTTENDFFYSVLNLNKATSRTEINERHRSLSLIFHPDKQQDENSKSIATQKFLEIQKAYQVLSDPFLREVYDVLGEEGLALKWSPDFRSKDLQEVRGVLKQLKDDIRYKKLDERILPRGALTCGIDLSSLFRPQTEFDDVDWPSRMLHRLEDIRIMNAELRHAVQKTVGDKTNISLESRIHRQGRLSALTLLGTVRHQFSPRFSSEAVLSFLHPHVVHLSGTYRENGNAASVRASIAPAILHRLPPSLTLSLSRKLFRRRLEVASLELHVGQQPHLKLELTSPTIFGTGSIDGPQIQVDPSNPPSTSGMKFGTTHRTFGIQFESIVPKLFGEWGITFAELSLRFKAGFEYGFAGFNWVLTGSWSNQTTELSLVTHLSGMGIVTELDIAHLEQRLSLPIVLAVEPNPPVLFCVLVAPSTVLVLGYHFIIKPRRRMQRLAHIRASRQALEEESGMRRQRDAISGLLKDTARRSQQTETSKGGLIILEATYGATESRDGANDLVIDVTVPLQALVRNSQLCIPTSQTKLGIQGFSDPAPFVDKELHIRYSFRGQMHYAEIPDHFPVVLPLAEHLVN